MEMEEVKSQVVTYPDPVLRLEAEQVSDITDEIKKQLDEMVEIMYEADGVGLAAPQIGDSRRIVVLDIGDGPIKVINPEIIEKSDDLDTEEEGCLSLPGITVKVKRPVQISVKCIDENGKEIVYNADGLMARAFQHEIDHLNGILIIDHTSSAHRALLRTKLRKLEKEYRERK
ncbi:peptide deformylase [bacterium]|nr:peptide deformylase [bacterium]